MTATAIGALANQMGIAIGFFLCPTLVPDGSDGQAITNLLLLMSILGLSSFLLTGLFRSKPPSPPSRSAEAQNHAESEKGSKDSGAMFFFTGIPKLFRNPGYTNLCLSFGINVGCFYVVTTLLSQMLIELNYSSQATALIGTLIVVVGIVGAFLFGLLADRTQKPKLLLIICMVGTCLSLAFWTACFQENQIYLLSFGACLLGFFMTALLPISMDVAVSISFPLPESLSSNVLLACAQLWGIFLVSLCTPLLAYFSILSVNLTVLAISVIPAISMFFFKGKNKRQMLEHTFKQSPSDLEGAFESIQAPDKTTLLLRSPNREQE